ncbi:MAG: hypothetical protein IPF99_12005 [Deltaproteobacteria bacterium]|nr:hypothetical protein [Deltaproteobacteria bacterium]
MADSYIDPRETLVHGAFAREQFEAVCLGLVPALDGTVKFTATAQAKADAAMKDVLDRQPVAPKTDGDPQAEARDSVVRFGKYIESIKGRPVEPPLSRCRCARRRALKDAATPAAMKAATACTMSMDRDQPACGLHCCRRCRVLQGAATGASAP